jgi:hypothetical protein
MLRVRRWGTVHTGIVELKAARPINDSAVFKRLPSCPMAFGHILDV